MAISRQVTISGKVFEVTNPYAAGHVLTEGEASQLNQVNAENVRNNLAAQIKDMIDGGNYDHEQAQLLVTKYADEYEMGVRRAGGPRAPADPVAREALRLALDKLSAKLRADGKKPSDYKNLKDVAAQLVEKNPAFMEQAKENIAKRDAMALDLEAVTSALEEKEADEQAEAAE
jgi:hypothetical protein